MAGAGLGYHTSSLYGLGSFAPKNNTFTRPSQLAMYVNAANGNFMFNQSCGSLATLGMPLYLNFTYNAQAASGNHWNSNVHTRLFFEESTLTRVGEDGHRTSFIWNQVAMCYLAEQNSSERITLEGKIWVYRNGSSRVSYEYDARGFLTTFKDTDNHYLRCCYVDDQLAAISEDTGNQSIQWQFNNGLVSDLIIYSEGKIIRHTHYEYDNNQRLHKIMLEDAGKQVFWTTYDYEKDSERIAHISQSDGIIYAMEYDEQGKIVFLSDGEGRGSTFTYYTGKTLVRNAQGEEWFYIYDNSQRLIAVHGPHDQEYQYIYEYNYLKTIQHGSLSWHFIYNEAGDCIYTKNPDGTIIERTFDSKHRLCSETKSFHQASSPGKSTHYFYDNQDHLRFTVAPGGVVTEYRYDQQGLCVSKRIFSETFSGEPLLQDLEHWTKEARLPSQLTEFFYDWRGHLVQNTTYMQINSLGEGVKESALITHYTYDAQGHLIEKSLPLEQGFSRTHYVYDSLGRLVAQVDNQGNQEHYTYDDLHQRMLQINAQGMQTIFIFDKSGLLISKQELKDTNDYGTTYYTYDAAGRLCSEKRPDGGLWYYFHTTLGLQAKINASGQVVEYIYNKEGRLTQTIEYVNLASEKLSSTRAFDELRPLASQADKHSHLFYNQNNQIAYKIEATGSVTGYQYNSEGQLFETIAYAQPITMPLSPAIFSLEPNAADRHHYFFYNAQGLLAGEIKGEGAAISYHYDNVGNLIETCFYFNRINLPLEGNWEDLKPKPAPDKDRHSYQRFNAAGFRVAYIDTEGYVKTFTYNERGLLKKEHAYAQALDPCEVQQKDKLPTFSEQDQIKLFFYNDLGLLIQEKQGNLTCQYDYNLSGLLVAENRKDEKTGEGRCHLRRYDAKGRLIASLDAEAVLKLDQVMSNPEQIEFIWQEYATHYTYDNADRLVSKMNALHQKSYFLHNKAGLLQYSISADGEICEFEYDNFNNLLTKIHYVQRTPVGSTLTLEDIKTFWPINIMMHRMKLYVMSTIS